MTIQPPPDDETPPSSPPDSDPEPAPIESPSEPEQRAPGADQQPVGAPRDEPDPQLG